MFAFKFDEILYSLYNKKWRLEEEIKPLIYYPPKLMKIKYASEDNTSNKDIVLYSYPSHYRHNFLFQYNFGIALYFTTIGSLFTFKILRDFYKKRIKLILLVLFYWPYPSSASMRLHYSTIRLKMSNH